MARSDSVRRDSTSRRAGYIVDFWEPHRGMVMHSHPFCVTLNNFSRFDRLFSPLPRDSASCERGHGVERCSLLLGFDKKHPRIAQRIEFQPIERRSRARYEMKVVSALANSTSTHKSIIKLKPPSCFPFSRLTASIPRSRHCIRAGANASTSCSSFPSSSRPGKESGWVMWR